jgi:hypothetical protein
MARILIDRASRPVDTRAMRSAYQLTTDDVDALHDAIVEVSYDATELADALTIEVHPRADLANQVALQLRAMTRLNATTGIAPSNLPHVAQHADE